MQPLLAKPQQFVVYLRVSTTRQGTSGLGLEAQRNAVDDYMRSVGGVAIAELIEIESGAKNDRPILVQSIALCRKHKSTLLIAKLDRLGRNVAVISSLMESSVDFVAADAPYANKLMLHILAAFAEHERELISQRTKAALAAAKQRGVVLGVNGHRLGEQNRRHAVEFAQNHKSAVTSALQAGAKTLQEIGDHLNRNGSRTREGALWAAATVRRLLMRLNLQL